MFRSNISEKLKWVLVLGLALLLLTTFISCGGDLVGPRLHDETEPDERPEEQDPDEGGGTASGKQIAQPGEDTAATINN
ncbi:MAG: hypothetical protein V3U73_06635 [bacterium]